MVATTWDPNAKSAGVTLSGGNLVASVGSGSSNVAATRSITGPTYFEVSLGANLSGTASIGICNRGINFAAGTLLGADANGCGYRQSGAVVINGATVATIATYLATNSIGVAVDIQNRLIWFRVGAGNWNNDVIGNQNPVGSVGGISLSTMTLGSALPACGATFSITADVFTAIFTSGFAQTAPTGYITIDTCAATATNSATPKGATYSTVGPTTNNAVTTTIAARASWLGLGRNYQTFTPAGAIKSVSGQVQESGTPTAGKTVYLYDHNTGELLGTATSDGSGNFSIPALGRAKTFGVALDDPTYNALVYDAVVPV
jgi:hypothetical protein